MDKSGDKSPQSKRCRACETACRMPVPHVRYRLNTYETPGYSRLSLRDRNLALAASEYPKGIMVNPSAAITTRIIE